MHQGHPILLNNEEYFLFHSTYNAVMYEVTTANGMYITGRCQLRARRISVISTSAYWPNKKHTYTALKNKSKHNLN